MSLCYQYKTPLQIVSKAFTCFVVVLQPKLGLYRLFLRFLDHTQLDWHSLTSLNEWLPFRRDRYLHNTPQTQEKNIHALGEIQTRIPKVKWPQTYALDHAATGIGQWSLITQIAF